MHETLTKNTKEIIDNPELLDLKISIPRLASDKELEVVDNEILKAKYNGNKIEIHVDINSTFFSESKNINTNLKIQIFSGDLEVAQLFIWALTRNGETEISTKVENFDIELRGLGRTMWELSLRLAQEMANKWGTPVIHNVYKMPNKSLGSEKWDELFLPLLEKYDYTVTYRSDWWEKIYYPQNYKHA